MTKRTLGPVTAGATMGTAAGILLVGAAARLGVSLSGEESWAILFLATGLGGYLVRPRGEHRA